MAVPVAGPEPLSGQSDRGTQLRSKPDSESTGDANIKLASVASDVLGQSGRSMLQAMITGETSPEKLAEMARGQLRKKLPALQLALDGSLQEHHRF
jgi:hypothetical protein